MLLWLSRSLCFKLSEAVDLAASVLALQCKRLLRKSWQLYAFCVGLFGCPLTQAGRRVGLMLLALVTREWEVWHLLCHLGGLTREASGFIMVKKPQTGLAGVSVPLKPRGIFCSEIYSLKIRSLLRKHVFVLSHWRREKKLNSLPYIVSIRWMLAVFIIRCSHTSKPPLQLR